MVDAIYCAHCGVAAKHPVTKMIDGQQLNFCCNGCLQVYEMMLEEGLISNQRSPVPQPAPLVEASASLEAASSQTITFEIAGMSCSNCVTTIERSLRKLPGVLEVHMVLATGCATVKTSPGRVSMADIRRSVEKAGYRVV